MSKEMPNFTYEKPESKAANDNAEMPHVEKENEALRLDNLEHETKARLDLVAAEIAEAALKDHQKTSPLAEPLAPVESFDMSGTANATLGENWVVSKPEKTWNEEINNLSAAVKKAATESLKERSQLKSGFYEEQMYADNVKKWDHNLKPLTTKEYISAQLNKAGVFDRPGANGQPLNREKTLQEAHKAVLKMTPQELQEMGISSGQLNQISPDDSFRWNKLSEKIEQMRSRGGFWRRLFRGNR